ncbi:penicillin-binding protein 2 [Sphingosinicella sp. YJ22]|uniref:penicillin-binding protein 2 n=1 Tax=Sphingosinicella sp. YJ22 TaxID=1104780 RepID=UPI00140993A0|nr:penicillin-binding protein 2 [Sphingosinicella sp. YJ22]
MKRRSAPLVTEQSQAITFTRRSLVFGALQGGVGVLLAGRMGYIAIAENERSQVLAEENRIQMRLIPPRRGWIVDRNGQPMAQNRSTFRVDLLKERIEDVDYTLAQLTHLLGLQAADVERIRTELERATGSQPVAVAENLTYDQYAAVTLRQPELPGVSPLRAFSRHYPAGSTVGHLIGYVGTPNREEYLAANRDPLMITPGFKIGKEGLEKTMEGRLRGTPGAARIEVTARGRLVRELETLPDRAGQPLQTTIDAGLQEYAGRRLGEESGACIVMDCRNGNVLCMASMPAYDPNVFTDGISQLEWSFLAEDERRPLLNKALNGLYPPGSTFKPSIAMALLQAGIDPEERVSCGGGYNLGNRFFRCLGRHGPVNMHTAIARSCNTYFYAMGRRAGIDVLSDVCKRMGFGQKFASLPVVSQSYGTMPDDEWKRARFERNRRTVERPDWTESDTLNTSIGQGFVIVNPMQLAISAARIASGRMIQPRLLPVRGPEPGPLPWAQEHFEAVRSGMWEVVNGAGTAGRSRLPFPDIHMAGKTGTAQVRRITASQRGQAGTPWKYRDHGLFIFFAPTENPIYAGAVVIEHGMGGSRAAAPVAKDVLTYLFDRDMAMEALAPLEEQWGGTLAERTARRAEAWAAAHRSGRTPPQAT